MLSRNDLETHSRIARGEFVTQIALLAITFLSTIALNSCTRRVAETATTAEQISFYEVPLVCGADPDIGCGSRSKPALLEMEKHPEIKEAWLNRAGPVLAIVWRDSAQTARVVKPILDEQEIEFAECNGEESHKQMETFRKSNLWYEGADVDKLSIEESGTIAGKYVRFALDRQMVSTSEAERLKDQIEGYFKGELVKIRTNEELAEASRDRFQQAVLSIGEREIGKVRSDRIAKAYVEYKEACMANDTCTADAKSACCKK